MKIRDAVPEDAQAACEVVRRSIIELCAADHHNDPAILERWLANKTAEIVASWIRQPGNSVLVAVEGNAVLAAGSVTDEDAKKQYPQGWKAPKPYIRIVPQPRA